MPTAAPVRPVAARPRWRTALLFVGALLFLFEEWLWTGFLRLFAWLGRFGLLRWVDARLVRLSPITALVILCIPVVVLFPIKVVGLWMIGSGRFVGGCCVMLAAKVLSTAVVARIFVATRPQLLKMPWFARLYAVCCALRVRVHDWLARQPAWRDAKRLIRRVKAFFARRPDDHRAGTLRRWRSRRRAAVAAEMARTRGIDEP